LNKEYDPKIEPYPNKLDLPEKYNWAKFVNGDVMIDVRGVPHLLEINGIPNPLFTYCELYDTEALEHLVDLFPENKKVGMIIKAPNSGFKSNRAIISTFKRSGYNTITIPHDKLKIDENGLYTEHSINVMTDEESKIPRCHFNHLLNRCFGKAKLFKLIPKERRQEMQRDNNDSTLIDIVTPILYQSLAINKDRTYEELKDFIPVPETYTVNSPQELEQAIEAIHRHVQEEHPEYQKPWIVTKPARATGGIGINFIYDKDSQKPLKDEEIKFPVLVQERISSYLFNERECDTRVFFTGGGTMFDPWASNALVRAAVPGEGHIKYSTSMSMGGDVFRMSKEANETLAPYLHAMALGIELSLQKRGDKLWEKIKK